MQATQYKKRKTTDNNDYKPYRPKKTLRTFMKRRPTFDRPGFFKLRLSFPLQVNSTGTGGGFSYGISNTNPSAVFSRDGAAFGTAMTDWQHVASLYDSYKVSSVHLQYVPIRPNDDSGSTPWQPLYVTYDPDTPNNYTVITSADIALQYDNTKVMNLYQPWELHFKNPNYSMNGQPYGWLDVASPSAFGSIWLYSIGNTGTANFPYGTIVVTMYVVAKNRR